MTPITDYREDVSIAMGKWQAGVRSDEELYALSKLLGCYYVDVCNDNDLPEPDTISDSCEEIASGAIHNLLSMYIIEAGNPELLSATIVDGLSRSDRWRECLKNRASAYSFVVAIIQFFETGLASKARSYAEHAHHRTVAIALNQVLVTWLAPDDKDTRYNRRTLASALFGEAWCVFTIDSLGRRESVAAVLESKRPPFVSGVVSFDMGQESDVLPVMSL